MEKIWKVAIVKDTSKPMLGLHGLYAAFRGLPNVEVAALADSNTEPEHLAEALELSGAKRHYASVEDMYDREKPDIAVLCSRHPGDHLGQFRSAAEHGIHVYCEKPMAATLEEADEMARIAEKYKIRICVAHPARYYAPFLTMKKMIEDGVIGRPLTAIGRGKCDDRGGGEDLIVLGTHILDLMTFFFGNPRSVISDISVDGRPAALADFHEPSEPVGPVAGDDIMAVFDFRDGIRGIFESRKGLRDRTRETITVMGLSVIGTNGTLSLRFDDRRPRDLKISRLDVAPDDAAAYEVIPVRDDRVVPAAAPIDYSLCGRRDIPRAPMFVEANRFAAWDLTRSIEETRLPVSNVYSARTALEMICGIYASHLDGKRIAFPLSDRRR
ncbi:MAG: Gfo/Idh/MocA family oxidoreductase [Terracidiphilus sp.]